MTIPASIFTSIASLQAGIKSAFPLTQTSSQNLGILQAEATALTSAVTAALAADDTLINAASLDASIAEDISLGYLAGAAEDLTSALAVILEDYRLVQLQALTQRIQTNLLNVGA